MTILEAVDRGIELTAQIEQLQEELKACEAALRGAALLGEQIPLEDPERDGRQFLAKGSRRIVPVVLTADLVQKTFGDGSPVHQRLEQIAGESLQRLYTPVTTWEMNAKDGKAFRLAADRELGGAAVRFVEAALMRDRHGIPKSQIKVEWKRSREEVAA